MAQQKPFDVVSEFMQEKAALDAYQHTPLISSAEWRLLNEI